MFKTFIEFLTEKGMTSEAFNELSKDGQLALHKEHSAAANAAYEKAQEGNASIEDVEKMQKQLDGLLKTEIKAIHEANSEQGLAIKALLERFKGGKDLGVTEKGQIRKFIEDNAEEIVKMKAAGTGTIKLNVTKVVGPLETTSATNPDGIPELVGVQMAPPSRVNLRSAFIDSLITIVPTSIGAALPYTESVPKDGDFAFVLEKGTKPQIDFKIETRYATPKKVAAHEVLTDESIKDIPGMQALATDYLRSKHDLKRQNGILFGDGLGANPEGATVIARTFVAGAMALSVPVPNFMDVVNACITDVYTTPNFQDEIPYMANITMISPIDFYLELVSAKTTEGIPLYPMASLFNQVTIGGTTIIPELTIPTGKIFVSDLSKYNVSRYVEYEVTIGWINDQLITNQFTMVGESRFHAYVKELDKAAFIYDDIATIRTAITEL